MKAIYIWCMLMVWCSVCACQADDDVVGIFTGKTWKLTGIYFTKGNGDCMDYWIGADGKLNKEAHKLSLKHMEEASTYTITFNGIRSGNVIQGDFEGRATTAALNGTWKADAVSRVFGVTTSQQDNEVLGNAFIEGLRNAYQYKGDYDNLVIYFKRNGNERYILMRVVPQ